MPTYAYRCTSCGVEFERFQKFTDKPLTRCPECRGKVNRVPQAAGIVFKGSGWYIKDSKAASSTTSGKKSDGKETTSENGKSEAKSTEAKAAAPSD
ncbi:MAG: zinc ribbon domain-containing protein [Anaerolineales bacterium]|nr:zinc ribbon domain-containing protein [Anaerolineales bacterium]